MTKLSTGDSVVLISGSMRMAVETVEDEVVHTVWCHEGVISRDKFDPRLLRKWEDRSDRFDGAKGPGDKGAGRPPRGDNRGGPRDRGDRDRGDRDGRDDRPRGKPGWDGKPREKKFFRKD